MRVSSENRIDTADLVPPVYQTCGKWLRCRAFQFSDTTRSMTSLMSSRVDNFFGSSDISTVLQVFLARAQRSNALGVRHNCASLPARIRRSHLGPFCKPSSSRDSRVSTFEPVLSGMEAYEWAKATGISASSYKLVPIRSSRAKVSDRMG